MLTRAQFIAISVSAAISVLATAFWRWRDNRVKPPVVAHAGMLPSAGYQVGYVDLQDNEKKKTAYGFPTRNVSQDEPEGRESSAPVLRFDVANNGKYELRIRALYVEVLEHRVNTLYVGNGQLCGAADLKYQCRISSQLGLHAVDIRGDGREYIVIPPGTTQGVTVHVFCGEEGVYRMRPVFDWGSLGLRRREVVSLSDDTLIIFFGGETPGYARPIRAEDSHTAR